MNKTEALNKLNRLTTEVVLYGAHNHDEEKIKLGENFYNLSNLILEDNEIYNNYGNRIGHELQARVVNVDQLNELYNIILTEVSEHKVYNILKHLKNSIDGKFMNEPNLHFLKDSLLIGKVILEFNDYPQKVTNNLISLTNLKDRNEQLIIVKNFAKSNLN